MAGVRPLVNGQRALPGEGGTARFTPIGAHSRVGHFVALFVRYVVVTVGTELALVRLFSRVDAGVDSKMLGHFETGRTLVTVEGFVFRVAGPDVLFHVAFAAETSVARGAGKGPCCGMANEMVLEVEFAEESLFAVGTFEGTFSAVFGPYVDG